MDLENKYGTLEIQKECVSLLKEFHSFCVSNGIVYSIAYGTLLGAVRHKGFIPWDDDVDVIVDRDNYQKILQSIGSYPALKIERITQNTLWTDRVTMSESRYTGSYYPTLDIFLLDNVPDNQIVAKFKLFLIYALQGMIKYHLSLKKGSAIMKFFSLVTWLMGRPFSHKVKYNWYQKVSCWGDGKDTKNTECYNTLFTYIHTKFPAGVLNNVQEVQFEDATVLAMTNYDGFLKAQYGDYMTPPKDKAPSHMKA
mgnify:CR=1 FL=1